MSTKKILIVEDEHPMAEALRKVLAESGFNVVTAKDGLDGLKRAKKEKPDLILLDIIMPKMDGMTMLKKMRAEEWGKKMKVIILTNLSGEDEIVSAIENGVYDYLVKSGWSLKSIVKKVNEKLK